MLKLIIVDDERATREKLIENIEWNKLDIEVSGEAKDGIEGLELVKSVNPDIILLDVRMPKLNGIECAAEIRKLDTECKIIFLSGFTDKEYLKSAIQLKAMDYIEKPIDIDEFYTVLKNTAALCKEEKEKKLRDNKINDKIEQSLILIKQELALELVRRNPDKAYYKKQFDELGMRIAIHDNFRCVLLKFNLHKIEKEESFEAFCNDKTLANIYSKVEGTSNSCIAGVMDQTHVIMHVFGKAAENTAILRQIISLIQEEFNAEYNFKGIVTAGAGKLVRGIENIWKSFQNAQKALQKSFLKEYGCVIFLEDEVQAGDEVSSEDIIQRIKSFYQDSEKEGAEKFINELVENYKKENYEYDVTAAKGIFLQIMMSLISLAKENNLAIAKEWINKEIHWAELLNTCTIDEIAVFIIDKLNVLFTHTQEQKGKSIKIRMALEYIREHCVDDISVVEIAAHLDMRSTYLSTLFKKETGKTLSEYIEGIRIEKAKELLKDGRLRVNEVAKLTGYNNANYFTSVFNKIVGVYPSEYRMTKL